MRGEYGPPPEALKEYERMGRARQEGERSEAITDTLRRLGIDPKKAGRVMALMALLGAMGYGVGRHDAEGEGQESHPGAAGTFTPTDEGELRPILPRAVEIEPGPGGRIVLHQETGGGGGVERREVPGDVIEARVDCLVSSLSRQELPPNVIEMIYGRRDFSRAEAEQIDLELLKAQWRQTLDDVFPLSAEGSINPEMMRRIMVKVRGFSDPSGWRHPDKNRELSGRRAQLVEEALRQVLAERGLANAPIEIATSAEGADGDVLDFLHRLQSDFGYRPRSKGDAQLRDEAERIIRAIHDNNPKEVFRLLGAANTLENKEKLMRAFYDTVESKSRAEVDITVETKDVVNICDRGKGGGFFVDQIPGETGTHRIPIEVPILILPFFIPILLRRIKGKPGTPISTSEPIPGQPRPSVLPRVPRRVIPGGSQRPPVVPPWTRGAHARRPDAIPPKVRNLLGVRSGIFRKGIGTQGAGSRGVIPGKVGRG